MSFEEDQTHADSHRSMALCPCTRLQPRVEGEIDLSGQLSVDREQNRLLLSGPNHVDVRSCPNTALHLANNVDIVITSRVHTDVCVYVRACVRARVCVGVFVF